MATESIRVSGLVPATPKQVYDAWLDGVAHSKFAGGKATIEPKVGGKHTARDGYASGKILELEPNRKLVCTWRSTDFPADAPDSRLEVVFGSRPGLGTEITFLHSNIPEGLGRQCEEGWLNHYLTPMRRYFTTRAAQAAKAAAAKAAKPPAPPKPAAKPAPKAAPKHEARPARATAPKKAVKAAKKKPAAKANKAGAKKQGAKKAKSR